MQPVRRYARNQKGTDFVIGDINGCYMTFEWLLEELGFSEETDRVFVTGNLIGASEESYRVSEFIDLPWFHSILGTHDYRFVDYWHNHTIDVSKINRQYQWTEKLHEWQLVNLIDKMAKLPVAIELVTEDGLFGFVHGDCSAKNWKEFVKELREDNSDKERVGRRVTYQAVFGRDRYIQRNHRFVEGIKRIYCGHSNVKNVTCCGNVYYIDAGVATGGRLTGINLSAKDTRYMTFVKPKA